jgi:Uma2 family endonuclease
MIAHIPMHASDDDILAYSLENPTWTIEREPDGSLVLSPPGGSATGARGVALVVLLHEWNERAGRPGKVFGPDAGFKMPDTAILSPDAAWVRNDRWDEIAADERERYAPLVPDVCIELVSPSDSVPHLRRKMMRYRAYGASYVVLIDPADWSVVTNGTPPVNFPADFNRVVDA